VPDSAIAAGEFEALLAMFIVPDALAAVSGANVTSSEATSPTVKTSPASRPDVSNPVPDVVTFEIERFEFPVFVTDTVALAELPSATLPKLKLDGVAVSTLVAATPTPARGMRSQPAAARVVSDTVPDSVPADLGAKCTVNEVLLPLASANGVAMPVIVKPLPETECAEIVTLVAPVLVTVALCVPLDPTTKL
jgi:hypothetical protein